MAELELIDRRALGIGKAKREIFDVPEYADGWNSAIEMLENAPTIEAKPVVHAHWEEVRKGRHICSNCKVKASLTSDEYDYMEDLSDYCHSCGAQMDEVVSDTNVGSKMDEPFPQAHENGGCCKNCTDHIAEAGKKENDNV